MGEDQGKDQQGRWWESVKPPNQDEQTDEPFYKHWQKSQSPALILVGNFNLLSVCWKYNTTERKQLEGS